jgi:hypothetical protein
MYLENQKIMFHTSKGKVRVGVIVSKTQRQHEDEIEDVYVVKLENEHEYYVTEDHIIEKL